MRYLMSELNVSTHRRHRSCLVILILGEVETKFHASGARGLCSERITAILTNQICNPGPAGTRFLQDPWDHNAYLILPDLD